MKQSLWNGLTTVLCVAALGVLGTLGVFCGTLQAEDEEILRSFDDFDLDIQAPENAPEEKAAGKSEEKPAEKPAEAAPAEAAPAETPEKEESAKEAPAEAAPAEAAEATADSQQNSSESPAEAAPEETPAEAPAETPAETAPASDASAEDGTSKDAGSDAGKDTDSASVSKDQAGTAETAKEAADKPKSKSKKAAKKSKGGSLMQFIPGMSGGKKTEKQEPEPEVPFVPLEQVIPNNALMIVRANSLNELNDRGKDVLGRLELGTLGPIDWLKFSAYGKALSSVNLKRPVAVVYIPVGIVPRQMFIIPVKNYRNFITNLGADAKTLPEAIPEGFVSQLKTPAGYLAYPCKGYAVIVEPLSKGVMAQLQKVPTYSTLASYTPAGLKAPNLSLELTEFGIQHFVDLGNAALSDFSPVFSSAMKQLELNDPELNLAEDYFKKATEFTQWVSANVQTLRLDLTLKKDVILTAISILPKRDSELEQQILSPRTQQVATTMDLATFLKVVPALPSPLMGQADLPAETMQDLQAPFNRIRHVEYTFLQPGQGELLAESWCFFLEVDDSAKFVEELIVPDAEKIGSHIASQKGAELGAEIFGNMAVRRQEGLFGGRLPQPPMAPTPEEAAARGEKIGALIGGLIGKSAGKKVGMKTTDFEGYDLYTSDLVLYTEQMKQIRAEQAGTAPPKPKKMEFDGRRPLVELLKSSLGGLLNGDLNVNFQDVLGSNPQNPNTTPLLARKNHILVLDKTHLLIVPGNENVLRLAKNNWERVRNYFIPPEDKTNQPQGKTDPTPAKPRKRAGLKRSASTGNSVLHTVAYGQNDALAAQEQNGTLVAQAPPAPVFSEPYEQGLYEMEQYEARMVQQRQQYEQQLQAYQQQMQMYRQGVQAGQSVPNGMPIRQVETVGVPYEQGVPTSAPINQSVLEGQNVPNGVPVGVPTGQVDVPSGQRVNVPPPVYPQGGAAQPRPFVETPEVPQSKPMPLPLNAVANQPQRLVPDPVMGSWQWLWEEIRANIGQPGVHQLRSAASLDLARLQQMLTYANAVYALHLPEDLLKPLPLDTPALLGVSTTSLNLSYFYMGIPTDTIRNGLRLYMQSQSQTGTPAATQGANPTAGQKAEQATAQAAGQNDDEEE